MLSHRISRTPAAVICVLFFLLLVPGGCAFRAAQGDGDLSPPGEEGPRLELIAVLPVIDRVGDVQASEMLRNEVLQHLYFKGYPKIPLAYIDERLQTMAAQENLREIPPRWLGTALGVDGLLFTTLSEWSTSRTLLYGFTEIEVSFELKSVETGETLWRGRHGVKDRHMAITPGRVEDKAHISYTAALRVVLDEAMSTLADGPEALGPPLPDTRPWHRRIFRR